VISPSEFTEARRLTSMQRDAVALIRRLARKNHDDAMPSLQARVGDLGFQDKHLWKTLAWIRELAPIVIHVDLDKLLEHMESDTHYRNQFETGTGGGTVDTTKRSQWEHDLFGGCYDDVGAFQRCKYGVMNVMNDHRGVINCYRYGDSYLVLKDVRLRCTFAPCDSSCCDAEQLAVLDYYGHVLNEYDDGELAETVRLANASSGSASGDSSRLDICNYKEAQIHGEVRFDSHIERLVASERHRENAEEAGRIQAAARMWGWKFSWMDEEHKRLAETEEHKVHWKDRVAKLDVKIKEGFCKVGCGRRVAVGETKSGTPWTTCCRGCVLGFGHDRHCGKDFVAAATMKSSDMNPSMCGEPCKKGCGRPAAFGRNQYGKPFTTCCRGCATGQDHDDSCGTMPVVEAGKCKFGCGYDVARSKGGRTFDTCCRGCAMGQGHSAGCPGAKRSSAY